MDWTAFENYSQIPGRIRSVLITNVKRMGIPITPEQYFEYLKDGFKYCCIHASFLPREKFYTDGGYGSFCRIHNYIGIKFARLYKGKKLNHEEKMKALVELTKFETRNCACGSIFICKKGSERMTCTGCQHRDIAFKRWGG